MDNNLLSIKQVHKINLQHNNPLSMKGTAIIHTSMYTNILESSVSHINTH